MKDNKIRLLFFCSDYQVGLTQALAEQAIELSKSGKVDFFGVSSQNEMEAGLHNRIKDANVNMSIIENLDVHKNFKSLAKQIDELIESNKITHVNVHNNWQLALLAYIKYKNIIPRNFKIIYTIHGYRHNSPIKQIPAIAIIGTALLLTTDRVISMSSYVTNKFKILKYKTDLVFYMMNQPEFNKKENIINSSPLKLVFPAQFRHGKQQEILVKAVADYIKKTKDHSIRLILPGSGPTLNEIIELTKALNITENVVFPGKLPLNEVLKLYEDSNIAVISSNVETYGRCIAEPFALGRCVITRPTGIANDIIKDGVNGRLFNNAADLSKILIELHDNPEDIISMANKAFQDKSIFHREAVLDSYIKVLEKA